MWQEANLGERRKLLISMLEAVYVDTVEEKEVVALTPKAAFMPLFEVATTQQGSGVVLVRERELPPGDEVSCHAGNQHPEAAIDPCFWWRRGRVELPLKRGLMVSLAASWARVSTCVSVA